jgi:hypothetical protein
MYKLAGNYVAGLYLAIQNEHFSMLLSRIFSQQWLLVFWFQDDKIINLSRLLLLTQNVSLHLTASSVNSETGRKQSHKKTTLIHFSLRYMQKLTAYVSLGFGCQVSHEDCRLA